MTRQGGLRRQAPLHGLHQRRDAGRRKRRHAAHVDLAEHVALGLRDRRFTQHEIAVPQQGQVLFGEPDTFAQLRDPAGFEPMAQALERRLIGPQMYPIFSLVAWIVLPILAVVLAITLGIGLFSADLGPLETLKGIGTLLLEIGQALVMAFGSLRLTVQRRGRTLPMLRRATSAERQAGDLVDGRP